ncbi:hypothetical protein CEUSTIGMA_g2643.t1 [Chlamydomonas eustigma]|uniref:Ionotropic glutamate receptor C-terminal domain-containing protein n=1 Tax=Chlamydomonas eustigma TaxID=1157962 RepID=A0A250WWX1_9CHLO|nr:hypothetical protein CEUSTIGMA_g2643.t1 [Chlamydomonas eustigma]|eukprot:GAX75199.1 hypothetical protein CEUSTIGMA_g2643.t1 [Chlamydomonas eustigma]
MTSAICSERHKMTRRPYQMHGHLPPIYQSLAYALSKYDCLISGLTMTPERMPIMDFMVPDVYAGFQVMAFAPQVRITSITDKMLQVFKPFSVNLWLAILGLVGVSALTMYIFESGRGVNPDEFSWWEVRPSMYPWLRSEHLQERYQAPVFMMQLDRIGHCAYRGVTSVTSGETLIPSTGPGRIYGAGLVICFMILTASYTANLASILTLNSISGKTITSVYDILAQDKVRCVRNGTAHLAFVRQAFPSLKVLPTNPASEVGLAENMLAGKCDAAISTTPLIRYFLATNTELGCQMQLVGPVLSVGVRKKCMSM